MKLTQAEVARQVQQNIEVAEAAARPIAVMDTDNGGSRPLSKQQTIDLLTSWEGKLDGQANPGLVIDLHVVRELLSEVKASTARTYRDAPLLINREIEQRSQAISAKIAATKMKKQEAAAFAERTTILMKEFGIVK